MSPGIAERLENCLRRQIAAFEKAREDLAFIEEDSAETVTDEQLDAQMHHLNTVVQLDEELQLLMPEWHKASPSPSPEERTLIATLADEAQALAEDLHRLYEMAQEVAQAKADRLKGDQDAMRTGRNALRYHPNPGDGPQRMDRKA